MAGYNRIIMIGNLTRDPEYKQLTSGQAVCRLGLASNRQFKNRQTGTMVQEVCYVDIDVWGAQAESCRQYLEKGRAILVEGRLKLDMWEDQNGQSRNKHSIVADRIVFLSSAAQDTAQEPATKQYDAKEQEVLDQIQQIKSRAQQEPAVSSVQPAAQPKKQAAAQQPKGENKNTGEISFNDQPPFQDDLPF